jgi:hypothetical protein
VGRFESEPHGERRLIPPSSKRQLPRCPLRPRYITVVAVILAIVGCSPQTLLEKFTTPEEQAAAKGYIELLRQQQYEAVEKAMDPSLTGPSMRQTLVAMSAAIPASKPTSVKLIGAQRFKSTSFSTVNLTFEFQYPANWLVTNVAFKQQGGARTIIGLRVYPQSTSLEERNKFRLTGKTPLEYLVLALAVMVPLFIIYTLIVCIKTKLRGKKWPWVLFILFGFGKFAVDWTTGESSFGLLSVQLFGASAAAQLYGPWILAASVPIGAIMFLLKKKQLSAAESPS